MTGPDTVSEPSLRDLFSQFTRDFGGLVRDEVQLAKTEVTEEILNVTRAGGTLATAALGGFMTVLLLSFAAAWGLSEIVPEGVAFLIVAIVWGVVAGVLFLAGRKQMQAVNLKPEATIATIQEDVQWAKQQTS